MRQAVDVLTFVATACPNHEKHRGAIYLGHGYGDQLQAVGKVMSMIGVHVRTFAIVTEKSVTHKSGFLQVITLSTAG